MIFVLKRLMAQARTYFSLSTVWKTLSIRKFLVFKSEIGNKHHNNINQTTQMKNYEKNSFLKITNYSYSIFMSNGKVFNVTWKDSPTPYVFSTNWS